MTDFAPTATVQWLHENAPHVKPDAIPRVADELDRLEPLGRAPERKAFLSKHAIVAPDDFLNHVNPASEEAQKEEEIEKLRALTASERLGVANGEGHPRFPQGRGGKK